MSNNNGLINYNNNIENLIYNVRGQQVMLDCDLAMLYGVETKRLNESMKRNKIRFPLNFCFQLTDEEYVNLRSQNSTSNINLEVDVDICHMFLLNKALQCYHQY